MNNCICACEECNGARGDMPAEQFAALKQVPAPRLDSIQPQLHAVRSEAAPTPPEAAATSSASAAPSLEAPRRKGSPVLSRTPAAPSGAKERPHLVEGETRGKRHPVTRLVTPTSARAIRELLDPLMQPLNMRTFS